MNHAFLFFEFLRPEVEESNPSIHKKRKIEFHYRLKNQESKEEEGIPIPLAKGFPI